MANLPMIMRTLCQLARLAVDRTWISKDLRWRFVARDRSHFVRADVEGALAALLAMAGDSNTPLLQFQRWFWEEDEKKEGVSQAERQRKSPHVSLISFSL